MLLARSCCLVTVNIFTWGAVLRSDRPTRPPKARSSSRVYLHEYIGRTDQRNKRVGKSG